MTQEKPGEVECPACDGNGKTRQPAAPAEPDWEAIRWAEDAERESAPAEPRGPAIINLGDALKADMDRVTKRQAGERAAKNAPAEGEREPIETMIERSSLGTPEAKAIRAQCAPGAVDAVIKRAAELGPAWKYAGINLNPEHFETYMPEEHQAHAAHQCAEQTHLREQIQQLHSLLGQMERSADKQDEQLAAAQAEIARLRGLLERALPHIGPRPSYAEGNWQALYDNIRSALSASTPTKEPGGGG